MNCTDLTAATIHTIEAAKEVAKLTGVSEEGYCRCLKAAAAAGPEVVDKVKEALRSMAQEVTEKLGKKRGLELMSQNKRFSMHQTLAVRII